LMIVHSPARHIAVFSAFASVTGLLL
jgi:hypothetical protein